MIRASIRLCRRKADRGRAGTNARKGLLAHYAVQWMSDGMAWLVRFDPAVHLSTDSELSEKPRQSEFSRHEEIFTVFCCT